MLASTKVYVNALDIENLVEDLKAERNGLYNNSAIEKSSNEIVILIDQKQGMFMKINSQKL